MTLQLFVGGTPVSSVMELQQADQQHLLTAAPAVKQDVDIVDVGAAEAIVQLQQPPDMTTEVRQHKSEIAILRGPSICRVEGSKI